MAPNVLGAREEQGLPPQPVDDVHENGHPGRHAVEHYAAKNIAPAPKHECYGTEVVANTNEALPCACQAC